VTGTLTVADLTRFHYFHTNRRSWPISAVAVLYLPLWALCVALAPAVLKNWPGFLYDTIVPTLVLFLWAVAAGVMPYRNARKMFAAQRHLQEPVTYTFTADSIYSSGDGVSWDVAWNVLQSVRETHSLFLLYTAPCAAVILPKRFFRSRADLEAWLRLVHECSPARRIERPGVVAECC
jgi:hypothetical protein